MPAPEWFPTRRRFDDALDALCEMREALRVARIQHVYDLALIERLEAELSEFRKDRAPIRHRRG